MNRSHAVSQDSWQSKDTQNQSITPSFDDTFLDGLVTETKEFAIKSAAKQGIFVVQPASEWIAQAKQAPIPNPLFSELWFEGELCCLFASSNLGKSILSTSIADSISRGRSIPGFSLGVGPRKVLLFDFELSSKQFEARYSDNYQNHYAFSNNLCRVELDANLIVEGKSFEQLLNDSLEMAILNTGARILIIDNLTYLRGETEKSRDALILMKFLKNLKQRYDLSLLVLAHTPKRNSSLPITINDLSGSSMLGNFFDSAFTIGASQQDKSIRYVKQIKARQCEIRYGAENIIVCQIVKHSNFLEFEFLDFGVEREHLREVDPKAKEELVELAKQMHKSGKSQRVIANELNISVGAVNKYIHR